MELFQQKNGVLIDLHSKENSIMVEAVSLTSTFPFVIGYRIFAESAIDSDFTTLLKRIKSVSGKPVIYDHRKIGLEQPGNYNEKLLLKIKTAGADAVLIFPLAGQTGSGFNPGFLCQDRVVAYYNRGSFLHWFFLEEGGYVDSDIQQKIYLDAATAGVSHFMMSCNRIERMKIYCHQLGAIVGQLKVFFTAIDSSECENLPDIGNQIKQYKIYAVFGEEFKSKDTYLNDLNRFWESFQKKLEI